MRDASAGDPKTPTQERQMRRTAWYSRFTRWAARMSGRPHTFILALGLIAAWIITGPLFDFSDTWQLVINTATTIITFLMVFVIQNTQNRDTQAIQIKLDELIRATQGAHNALLDLEELEEDQLDLFRDRYERLAAAAREELEQGQPDTGTREP
jgi:low affinity Fe/Cu permease